MKCPGNEGCKMPVKWRPAAEGSPGRSQRECQKCGRPGMQQNGNQARQVDEGVGSNPGRWSSMQHRHGSEAHRTVGPSGNRQAWSTGRQADSIMAMEQQWPNANRACVRGKWGSSRTARFKVWEGATVQGGKYRWKWAGSKARGVGGQLEAHHWE